MRAEFIFEPVHNVNLKVSFGDAIPMAVKRLRSRRIIKVCADEFGVSPEDMLGPRRQRRITWARFAAWELMYQPHRTSFPEIGRKFDRDHSTILSGVLRSKELRDNVVYMEMFERCQMRMGSTGEDGE